MTKKDTEVPKNRLSLALWRVLSEKGLQGLTVRAVADEAGCTTGMVMYQFGTRQALLEHARSFLFERMLERVEAIEKYGSDPKVVLREVLSQSLTLDSERSEEARVWLSFLAASIGDDALKGLHVSGNRAWQSRIARLVLAAEPRVGDRADLVAKTLVALTDGLASLSIADAQDFSAATQKELLASAITSCLTIDTQTAPGPETEETLPQPQTVSAP